MVTGDYHDFFRREDGQTAIFLGDGSGHGPAAGLLVATMRTIMMTHRDVHRDPGGSLQAASRHFHSVTCTDLFMTGIYLLLEEEGNVSWASAGQDPPIRINRQRQVVPVDLTAVGMPMGVDPNEEYPTVKWRLCAGERLVLFTDGLVEALDRYDNVFGRERLRTHVATLAQLPLNEMVHGLVRRVEEHMDGSDFEDDFTIVAIERLGSDDGS
jgi:sigma-B regulation protein RsbU (phosphoserine phosphatase)